MLAEEARTYREGPEVQTAFESSGVLELAQPTLDAGESVTDLLADHSSFEDFDVDAAAVRNFGFVRLDQFAVEHLIG